MFEVTTSTVGDNSEGLTYEKLMAIRHELELMRPVVYYMASDYAPIKEDGTLFCLPNEGETTLGVDIVCHTSQVAGMYRVLGDKYDLRPMTDTEQRRRWNKKFGAKLGYINGI